MCAVNEYGKEHVPMSDDENIGGVRLIQSTSSKGELISLGQTINFIDNCLQWFEESHDKRIVIYK